jgi:hypothetical protein
MGAEQMNAAQPGKIVSIDDRLDNWGIYWRWRLGYDQAQSFEGRYRSGQPWHAVPTPPEALDPADADVIENAVCAIDLYHHALLKGWYVRRWDEQRCLHRAREAAGYGRQRGGSFAASMVMAKSLLTAELGRPAVTRKERAREVVRRALGLDPLTAMVTYA